MKPMGRRTGLATLLRAVVLGMVIAALAPVAGSAEAAPPGRGDACGARVAKPTGGWWSCTLADGFDGSALDTRIWTALRQPGPAGGACNVDDPRTVRVADGTLQLTVRPATGDLACPARGDGSRNSYASASVSTYYKWSQQYGRFEARLKVAPTDQPGLHEAFWLWPDARDGVPNGTEIDIVETYSDHPDLAIPYLHYGIDSPNPGVNTAWHCTTTRGEFHTYTLEWTADRLEILVDGRSCLVNTAGAGWFRKRFIMSFTQLLGAGANAYDGRAPLPATMEVDYVKVWK